MLFTCSHDFVAHVIFFCHFHFNSVICCNHILLACNIVIGTTIDNYSVECSLVAQAFRLIH